MPPLFNLTEVLHVIRLTTNYLAKNHGILIDCIYGITVKLNTDDLEEIDASSLIWDDVYIKILFTSRTRTKLILFRASRD